MGFMHSKNSADSKVRFLVVIALLFLEVGVGVFVGWYLFNQHYNSQLMRYAISIVYSSSIILLSVGCMSYFFNGPREMSVYRIVIYITFPFLMMSAFVLTIRGIVGGGQS